jgi:hypothetical protein
LERTFPETIVLPAVRLAAISRATNNSILIFIPGDSSFSFGR